MAMHPSSLTVVALGLLHVMGSVVTTILVLLGFRLHSLHVKNRVPPSRVWVLLFVIEDIKISPRKINKIENIFVMYT